MPDFTPFTRARGLIEQTPGGQQVYQDVLRQLNRQFGLRQRRETRRGEQLNLPPHLRFAIGQQQFPEAFGSYASGLAQASAQAPGIDIRKSQALAGIQSQVEQLRMAQRQLELQEKQAERSQRTNFWDVLGGVGGLGLGIAGLLFPPAGAAGMAMGGAGLGLNLGGAAASQFGRFQQNYPNYGVPPVYQPAGGF